LAVRLDDNVYFGRQTADLNSYFEWNEFVVCADWANTNGATGIKPVAPSA
jgi:hypothetical protein